MGQNPSAPPVSFDDGFTVGEWRINSRQASLSRGTETRHIEYKVMATLLLLARRPSQVVTRAEFLDEVWQGRVVNEEALSRAISLLRTALDDDVHEPRYIQTIPRTGYRLIAEVCALEPMNETQPRREWRFPRDSLAVLPFASLDGDGNEYIGAGLTEELSTALAKVPGLRVVSTTLARGLSPEELRQRLRVRAFTEGTVRQRGDTLRVTVRLIDADSGVQSWSEVYERSMRDIYELQNEIADAIVANLSDSLGIAPRIEPARTDTDAYRNFLLGRYHIERRGADNIRRGIERLEHAVAADPGFVRAHLLLANAYALLPSYAPVDERALLARAETILDQVRTLTGSEAATHRLRGFVRLRRGEWIAAEQAFRRAQVHTPDDVEMLQWHSVLLAAVGYLESALEQAQRAVATEPLSPIANLRLASVHTWLGDMEQADRCAKLALELGIDPLAGRAFC
jgi:DNA-binding winged helix-turn-helix (wHTH) protein/tetratricopeptide (TPR) repeat protein